MTHSQEITLETIKNYLPRFDRTDDRYEIKEFEVKDTEYGVYVYLVTGYKGDEGTIAEALCRKIRHFVIGKRGGIRSILGGKTKHVSRFELLNRCYEH
ncbi:MAG: hypothetical protein IJW67_11200 [Blautia sp.]|nr:hypothetical protein [Blautia sp.]